MPSVSLLGDIQSTATPTNSSAGISRTISDFTVEAGDDRLLVVATAGGLNTNLDAVNITYGGSSLMQGPEIGGSSTSRAEIWYLPLGSNDSPTTADVEVTYNNSVFFFATALAVEGADQILPPLESTSTSTSLISPTTDFVVSAIFGESDGTITAISPLTKHSEYLLQFKDPFGNPAGPPSSGGVGVKSTSGTPQFLTWNGPNQDVAHVAIGIPLASNVALEPEIDVFGNGAQITDGATVPDPNLHTDFGTVEVASGSVKRNFLVVNAGQGTLLLEGEESVQVTGPGAEHFTVTRQPSALVGPNSQSTDFVVRFDPSAEGTHTATITIGNNDSDEDPFDFTIQGVGIEPNIDLELTASESTDAVVAGSGSANLMYVVTVTNNGPDDATGVVLSQDLTLPTGVTRKSVTPSKGTFTNTTRPDGTWNLGNLASGASETLTIVLTADSFAEVGTDVIGQTAAVTSADQVLLNQNDDTVSLETSVTREVDLVVTKTESADSIVAGSGTGNLTYVVTVTNNGPSDASGVVLSEDLTLPEGVTVESIVGSGATTFVDTTWTVGDLAIGQSETLTVTLTVGASTEAGIDVVSNNATVTAVNETLVNITDDSATESTDVTREVDLVVTKTESTDSVLAGSGTDNLTYVVTVTNNGPSDATGVILSEDLTLPEGVTIESIVGSGATTFADTTWTVGDLAIGQSETLTVTLTVGASTEAGIDVVSNTATVTAVNETLVNTTDDSATENTDVTREVDLVVTKTTSADSVVAGSGTGNLTYVVTVTNNGPSDASGVVLSEDLTLPAGGTVESITPSIGTFTATTAPDGTWDLGNLAQGDSATLTVVLTVGASTEAGIDVIGTTATITAVNETNTDAENDTATESTSGTREIDIVLTKIASDDTVAVGSGEGNLVYTLTATNNGPSDATGVDILEDLTLPPFVSIDSIVVSAGTFATTSGPDGTWLVDLPAGASGTLTVTLTVGLSAATGIDVIQNSATVVAVPGHTRLGTDDDRASVATSIRTTLLAVGADAGGSPRVRVFNADGSLRFDFLAYEGGFVGGVRVALGDLNGDLTPDIITAAGPGGGPHIRIFDGRDLSLINEFFAYDDAFGGGVTVASGDVDGDGFDDVIVGADAGGTTHVRVFGGNGAGTLGEFFAFHVGFAGGVHVAVGDINGDGLADIIAAAGPGGTPHVKVIDARNINVRTETGLIAYSTLLANFFAYDPAFSGGLFVSAADVNGDGRDEVLTGIGPNRGSLVQLLDGTKLNQREANGQILDTSVLARFLAYESDADAGETSEGGVRVSLFDRQSDGTVELVTSAGPGELLPVRVLEVATLSEVDAFFAFGEFAGGVFVS